MNILTADIPGLLIIEPTIWRDERGYFFEAYNPSLLEALPPGTAFVQDNESCSSQGVVRGFHFQAPPHAQGKLVRVVRGKVMDVAVDLRKGSPHYGKHFSIELSSENKRLFWIPPGFGHAFQALENDTVLCYKCTALYHGASDGGVLWNDPDIGVAWPLKEVTVSPKDNANPLLRDLVSPF